MKCRACLRIRQLPWKPPRKCLRKINLVNKDRVIQHECNGVRWKCWYSSNLCTTCNVRSLLKTVRPKGLCVRACEALVMFRPFICEARARLEFKARALPQSLRELVLSQTQTALCMRAAGAAGNLKHRVLFSMPCKICRDLRKLLAMNIK